jgi:hypothetical protein
VSEPVNPAYAAPRAPMEGGVPTVAEPAARATACRIAGAFLLTGALVHFVPWAWQLPTQWQMLGPGDLGWRLGVALPVLVPFLIHVAVAVPLLRGSARFRALAIGVKALAVVLLVGYGVYAMSVPSRRAAHWDAADAVPSIVFALLSVAALVLLLTGRPSRGRMAIALVAIAMHVVSWGAALIR